MTAIPIWGVAALASVVPGIVLAREATVRLGFRRVPDAG